MPPRFENTIMVKYPLLLKLQGDTQRRRYRYPRIAHCTPLDSRAGRVAAAP